MLRAEARPLLELACAAGFVAAPLLPSLVPFAGGPELLKHAAGSAEQVLRSADGHCELGEGSGAEAGGALHSSASSSEHAAPPLGILAGGAICILQPAYDAPRYACSQLPRQL